MTIADLNGDGVPDLVTADYNSNAVSVLLGNGDGSFQPRTPFATGLFPSSVAVADLNGDHVPDIATADYWSDTVSVLLGNGDGSFQPRMAFAGSDPASVAVADLNGDGRPDLVTADYLDNAVSVLLGNGDGSFQPRTAFATGTFAISVAVADLNGDGVPDIVTAGSNTVSVLLGNGDGSFQPRTPFATGAAPVSVAVADLNGDGVRDIVTADYNSNAVSVLLGHAAITGEESSPLSVLPLLEPIGGIFIGTEFSARLAQEQLDSLLTDVNKFSGVVGSWMSRFGFISSALASASDNYRDASSRITDADVAEEAAGLVKNGILQQAGAAVLAQANQLPELVLSLLRAD